MTLYLTVARFQGIPPTVLVSPVGIQRVENSTKRIPLYAQSEMVVGYLIERDSSDRLAGVFTLS